MEVRGRAVRFVMRTGIVTEHSGKVKGKPLLAWLPFYVVAIGVSCNGSCNACNRTSDI